MQINRIDGLSHVVCAGNCWNACPLLALPKAAGGPCLFSTGGWLQPTPLFAVGSQQSACRLFSQPVGWLHAQWIRAKATGDVSFVSCVHQQASSPTCSAGEQHNMTSSLPTSLHPLFSLCHPFFANKGLKRSKI